MPENKFAKKIEAYENIAGVTFRCESDAVESSIGIMVIDILQNKYTDRLLSNILGDTYKIDVSNICVALKEFELLNLDEIVNQYYDRHKKAK